mmetsp:Transcript_17452/g.33078  ORF Transcript_17452/g.33078 Transcript_17452/m.33078 type:complete len:659 (-) Transcript_17452:971-2947(-)
MFTINNESMPTRSDSGILQVNNSLQSSTNRHDDLDQLGDKVKEHNNVAACCIDSYHHGEERSVSSISSSPCHDERVTSRNKNFISIGDTFDPVIGALNKIKQEMMQDMQGQDSAKGLSCKAEEEENGTNSFLSLGRDETPLSPISKYDHNLLDWEGHNNHEIMIESQKVISSLTRQLDDIKKDRDDKLIQIAKLGTRVMQMEKKQNQLLEDNKVLQKLLNTSREIALNQSLEQQYVVDKDNSFCSSEKHVSAATAVMKSQGGNNSIDLNGSFQSSFSAVEGFPYPQKLESLEKELRYTREREVRLVQQIKDICQVENRHGSDQEANQRRDAIMESLLDSQQEVVVYLRGEVDDLRRQLQEERNKYASQAQIVESTREMLQILERENQLVVAETIKNERLLEIARQDLSIKAGENACLRDEVIEWEQKSMQMLDLERRLPSRKMCPGDHDNTSETEDTLMTVEIESNNDINPEVQMLIEAKPSDQDVLLQKYQVIKKALKRKYQTKLKQLEEKLHRKETQVDQLTHDLKNQILSCKRHQEELEQSEIRRISNEIEMNQEIEGLKSTLRARETVVNALKVKMTRMQERCVGGATATTWDTMAGISDALIEGVGRSIELFEALSFVNEDNKNRNRSSSNNHSYNNNKMHHKPPTLSSKSFG